MSKPGALSRAALKDFPLPPVVDGDKETKGRILIVAGSREVAGAALLVAKAAMRAGAGKLQMATVEAVAIATALAMPEAKVVGLEEARDVLLRHRLAVGAGLDARRSRRGHGAPSGLSVTFLRMR